MKTFKEFLEDFEQINESPIEFDGSNNWVLNNKAVNYVKYFYDKAYTFKMLGAHNGDEIYLYLINDKNKVSSISIFNKVTYLNVTGYKIEIIKKYDSHYSNVLDTMYKFFLTNIHKTVLFSDNRQSIEAKSKWEHYIKQGVARAFNYRNNEWIDDIDKIWCKTCGDIIIVLDFTKKHLK